MRYKQALMENYRLMVLEMLSEKRGKNPRYSLRAFAKSCGVSPATLSQVIRGKRPLTVKVAKKIAERLALDPKESSKLLQAVDGGTTGFARGHLPATDHIELDQFHLISDWYHYGILSLSELRNHRATPEWISDKLGITHKQATEAVERLKKLGLLEVRGQKMRQISKPLVTSHDIPSSALRHHHRQMLARAEAALENISVEWREFGSMTLAMDPRRMPQAKRMLRRFRQQLAAICESDKPEIVYHLCFQFFPANHPERFLVIKERDNEKYTIH